MNNNEPKKSNRQKNMSEISTKVVEYLVTNRARLIEHEPLCAADLARKLSQELELDVSDSVTRNRLRELGFRTRTPGGVNANRSHAKQIADLTARVERIENLLGNINANTLEEFVDVFEIE